MAHLNLMLTCQDQRRRKGQESDTGWGDSRGEARHKARDLVEDAAGIAAFTYAMLFKCPAGRKCPNKKFTVKIEEPVLKKPKRRRMAVGAAFVLKWACDAKCDWSVYVYCRKAALPEEDQEMEEQDLECGEDEEAFACLVSNGVGEGKDKYKAKRDSVENALNNAREYILKMLRKVTCSGDCPNRKITVLFAQPVDVTNPKLVQPDANGDFSYTAAVRWAVWVSCY